MSDALGRTSPHVFSTRATTLDSLNRWKHPSDTLASKPFPIRSLLSHSRGQRFDRSIPVTASVLE